MSRNILINSVYAFASRGLQQFSVLQRLCSGLCGEVLSFLCLMPYPETEEGQNVLRQDNDVSGH